MKLISAIIRPERLPDVKAALFRVGVTGMTLSRVSGHGGEREVVERYRAETVVLDRGVPDVVGFLRVSRLHVPDHIDRAARRHRYNPRVFLAPFWAEIYTHDPERIQPADLARATEAVMRETYAGYGYRLVELPRATVAERVAFVLRHLEG